MSSSLKTMKRKYSSDKFATRIKMVCDNNYVRLQFNLLQWLTMFIQLLIIYMLICDSVWMYNHILFNLKAKGAIWNSLCLTITGQSKSSEALHNCSNKPGQSFIIKLYFPMNPINRHSTHTFCSTWKLNFIYCM